MARERSLEDMVKEQKLLEQDISKSKDMLRSINKQCEEAVKVRDEAVNKADVVKREAARMLADAQEIQHRADNIEKKNIAKISELEQATALLNDQRLAFNKEVAEFENKKSIAEEALKRMKGCLDKEKSDIEALKNYTNEQIAKQKAIIEEAEAQKKKTREEALLLGERIQKFESDKRDFELRQQEQAARDGEISQRDNAIVKKEKELKKLDETLNEREFQVSKTELAQDERETELIYKEKRLNKLIELNGMKEALNGKDSS